MINSKNKKILVTYLLVVASSMVNAGGFGVEFGQSPEKYGCADMAGHPGHFDCTPPKPHSAFESYLVKASDEHGICWVKGIGKDISDNGYGTSTKNKYVELRELLIKAYGEPSAKLENLIPGSIWDDGNEFLMSLRQKERYHISQWEDLQISSKPQLNDIFLSIKATSGSTGYVNLEYYSKAYDSCNNAVKEIGSDSL